MAATVGYGKHTLYKQRNARTGNMNESNKKKEEGNA